MSKLYQNVTKYRRRQVTILLHCHCEQNLNKKIVFHHYQENYYSYFPITTKKIIIPIFPSLPRKLLFPFSHHYQENYIPVFPSLPRKLLFPFFHYYQENYYSHFPITTKKITVPIFPLLPRKLQFPFSHHYRKLLFPFSHHYRKLLFPFSHHYQENYCSHFPITTQKITVPIFPSLPRKLLFLFSRHSKKITIPIFCIKCFGKKKIS